MQTLETPYRPGDGAWVIIGGFVWEVTIEQVRFTTSDTFFIIEEDQELVLSDIYPNEEMAAAALAAGEHRG